VVRQFAMPTFSALLIAPLMFLALFARADSPAVSEQALKAVLFYKLPLFVYAGTSDKRQPINICTLGEAPLGEAAEKLPSTLADGRRVNLRTLSAAVDADDCQYVFIGRSETVRLDSLLRRLSGRRVVTVSDIEGFAEAGGMVEFTLRPDGSGLLILINRKAAQKQGIEFNAQLLRLAKIVEP
jgi:hypothetical protein